MISKFKTAEEIEKQEKRTKKIFASVVIAVLLFSVAAYSFMSIQNTSQTGYGKFNFESVLGGWQSRVGDFFVITKFHPTEVDYINSTGTFNKDDFSNIVYFVSRTENERKASEEISKNILALKKDSACLPEYSETEECFNMTIKSCSDAGSIEKIVIIKESNETSIDYLNNCLIITGSEEELLRASDKALFMILGVIK